jgi:hypothetical protein
MATSVSINKKIYEDAKREAKKQHRSIASLVESLILEAGISRTGDQKPKKKVEIPA